jgi:hypothetical protein
MCQCARGLVGGTGPEPLRLGAAPPEQPLSLQHPVDAAGARRRHIGIEYHVGQAPVAIPSTRQCEGEDRLVLPPEQPEPARLGPGVPIGRAKVRLPGVVLPGGEPESLEQAFDRQPGAIRPIGHDAHHLVSLLAAHPAPLEPTPVFFTPDILRCAWHLSRRSSRYGWFAMLDDQPVKWFGKVRWAPGGHPVCLV